LIRQKTHRTAVTLSGISFSYQQRTVLKGIDLAVPAGSYCGIVGPNGSGKTTLAYLISGILSPATGSLDTHGLKVGLVLSNPANQIVSLVVEEDIAFGPENIGLSGPEIRDRIDYALGTIHCEHLRHALTSTLSGGQLAKIAYAGQIALDVDVLVLDEGTVMLDPGSREVLLKTIRELNSDWGKTIIHISHRLEDLECADRVLLIQDGTIRTQAPDALSLIKDLPSIVASGIEPGPNLTYRSFLKDLGIDEENIEHATRVLARRFQEFRKGN
jgi:energy-coupling factor transport system ATP-binding protein